MTIKLSFKSGLRAARSRLFEGVALAAVVWLAVSLVGLSQVIVHNMERHVYLQIRDRTGDVLLMGLFEERHLDTALGVDGVSSAVLYRVLPGARLEVGGEEMVVSVASTSYFDRIKVKEVEGRPPSGGGEALIYWALSGPPLDWLKGSLGSTVEVQLYTLTGEPLGLELEVVGVSWGFEWVGGRRVAVILSDELLEDFTGGMYTALAVYADNPGSRDLESLASRLEESLEADGAYIAGYWIVDPDENPIVVLLRGALSIVTVPSAALLALLVVLPAAAGTAMAVRESRVTAVLKAEGAGAREIAVMIMTPWMAWGVVGVALGSATVALAGESVYASLFVGDSEIARLLYSNYGFETPLQLLAGVALLGMAGVALGSLAPVAVSLSVDTVSALRSGELPIQLVPPRLRLPGPLYLASSARDLLARPWKLVGLAAALSIIWGIGGAMSSLGEGVDDIVELYSDVMPPDAYIVVESISLSPPKPVAEALEEAVAGWGGVEGYTIVASEEYVDALGLGEVFAVVTYAGGGPSTAFPLAEGRYPEGPGEAVTSLALAAMLDIEVGDRLQVELDGEVVAVEVVGLSYSRLQNGFYILVDPGYFERLTGSQPGMMRAAAHVDLADGSRVDEFIGFVRERLAREGFVAVSEALGREELVEALQVLSILLYAVMGGVLVLASLGVAVTVAAIVAVDVSARAREHAVLLAMGAPKRRILAGYALQVAVASAAASIPAYVIALYIAGTVAERSALAVGYIIPDMSLQTVLAPSNLLLALAAGLLGGVVAAYVYLSRLNLPSILRE